MTAFSFDNDDEVLSLICKPINRPGVIRHAFSTRCGGSSEPPYASLNMGFGSGDSRTCVLHNRAAFGQAVGFDPNHLLTLRQVHGNHVVVLATASDRWRAQGMPGDGLMTNCPRLPLGVITADCFPIILTLPQIPAVGVLHVGRQGAAKHLVPQAIARMCQEYSASAAEVFAAIGPGIGGCCYEVDEGSGAPFIRQFPASVEVYRPSRPGHLYLDLQQAIMHQLYAAGVPRRRVWSAGLCTACHPEWFFSYRRDGPRSGRMLNVVMIEADLPAAATESLGVAALVGKPSSEAVALCEAEIGRNDHASPCLA